MKLIQRILNLENNNYYVKHLMIVNCLLPTNLTKKEIEVLAGFMSLDKHIIEDDMFNTVARKKIRDALNLQSGGLSNYLVSMINKKVLDRNEITNRIKVKEFLLPEEGSQGYQIKIIKKEL